MQEKNGKIVVILGQTATGKSDLAVMLAKKFDGEIVSADSRQVYKGLDKGTGKITKREMKGVPHHMLDIAHPKNTFTVADFKREADKKIGEIFKRGKMPIVCGGTGFYIQSIVDGLVLPEVKPNRILRERLSKKSLSELVLMLEKLDKERLKNIDTKNKVRLVRAIEIAKAIGKVPKISKPNSPFDILQLGICAPESALKERINKRIFLRLKKGMVEETLTLHRKGLSFRRMNELGLEYRLLSLLIQQKITRKEFVEKLQKEIWQYAKRQKTWFKRDKRIKWFQISEVKKIEKEVEKFAN